MSVWWEVLLLVGAVALLVGLGAGPVRAALRTRRERQHFERMDRRPGVDDEPPRGESPLARRVHSAGVDLPIFLVVALLALGAALAGFAVLLWTGLAIAAIAVVFLTLAFLWSLLGSRARSRSLAFEERLIDAVGLMIAILEAGESPRRALEGSAEGAEEPVAGELRRVVHRLEAGATIAEALAPIRRGYDSEGVRLFTQTLIAKWDTGGELAPILHRIHRTMLERLSMRLRLQSELAGARLSAIIVALLPYVLIPFFAWRRPEWLAAVFAHPLGLQLLVGAILLQIIGILWLRSLFRLETV